MIGPFGGRCISDLRGVRELYRAMRIHVAVWWADAVLAKDEIETASLMAVLEWITARERETLWMDDQIDLVDGRKRRTKPRTLLQRDRLARPDWRW